MNETPSKEEIEAALSQPAIDPAAPIQQSVVNHTVRVLRGRKLKYTARVLFRNGLEVEFQCDEKGQIERHAATPGEVITTRGYTEHEVIFIPWGDVLVFRQEENVQ
jgi:hypothetical protein